MTEQQPYEVLRHDEILELRRYPPHVVAEVVIAADFEEAGNRAFRSLFGYLNGENDSRTEVAMTAPVVQQAATSPGSFRVAFVLPAAMTLETASQPTNPVVQLHLVPESTAAVVEFTGRWTEASYQRHLAELRAAVEFSGLTAIGSPRFSRFDAPYVPAFMRRNEVMIDVQLPEDDLRE